MRNVVTYIVIFLLGWGIGATVLPSVLAVLVDEINTSTLRLLSASFWVGGVIGSVGAILLCRRYLSRLENPTGLKGWLLVVGVQIVVTVLWLVRRSWNMAQAIRLYEPPASVNPDAVLAPGYPFLAMPDYRSWIFLAIAAVALIVGITAIYLFVKKHYRFSIFYIGFLLLSTVAYYYESFNYPRIRGPNFAEVDQTGLPAFWLVYVPAMVSAWVVYALVSERVKNTFVVGRKVPPSPVTLELED